MSIEESVFGNYLLKDKILSAAIAIVNPATSSKPERATCGSAAGLHLLYMPLPLSPTPPKKIIYAPGIISLCILPILFCYYGEKQLRASNRTAIRVAFPTIQLPGEFPDAFSEKNFPPLRQYTDIRFTGDMPTDQLKLAFAQVRAREILSVKDSVNGVHFSFDALCHYGTFIRALDMLSVENAVTYVSLRNNLWFYYLPPKQRVDSADMQFPGCSMVTEIKAAQPSPSFYTKLRIAWASSRELIISFVLFLAFIFLLKVRLSA